MGRTARRHCLAGPSAFLLASLLLLLVLLPHLSHGNANDDTDDDYTTGNDNDNDDDDDDDVDDDAHECARLVQTELGSAVVATSLCGKDGGGTAADGRAAVQCVREIRSTGHPVDDLTVRVCGAAARRICVLDASVRRVLSVQERLQLCGEPAKVSGTAEAQCVYDGLALVAEPEWEFLRTTAVLVHMCKGVSLPDHGQDLTAGEEATIGSMPWQCVRRIPRQMLRPQNLEQDGRDPGRVVLDLCGASPTTWPALCAQAVLDAQTLLPASSIASLCHRARSVLPARCAAMVSTEISQLKPLPAPLVEAVCQSAESLTAVHCLAHQARFGAGGAAAITQQDVARCRSVTSAPSQLVPEHEDLLVETDETFSVVVHVQDQFEQHMQTLQGVGIVVKLSTEVEAKGLLGGVRYNLTQNGTARFDYLTLSAAGTYELGLGVDERVLGTAVVTVVDPMPGTQPGRVVPSHIFCRGMLQSWHVCPVVPGAVMHRGATVTRFDDGVCDSTTMAAMAESPQQQEEPHHPEEEGQQNNPSPFHVFATCGINPTADVQRFLAPEQLWGILACLDFAATWKVQLEHMWHGAVLANYRIGVEQLITGDGIPSDEDVKLDPLGVLGIRRDDGPQFKSFPRFRKLSLAEERRQEYLRQQHQRYQRNANVRFTTTKTSAKGEDDSGSGEDEDDGQNFEIGGDGFNRTAWEEQQRAQEAPPPVELSDEERSTARRAYLKQSLQWHPDKWVRHRSLIPNVEVVFQRIVSAYDFVVQHGKSPPTTAPEPPPHPP